MYHITEAKLALFLLSCAEKQVFLSYEKVFSSVGISRVFGIDGNEANVFKWCTRASRAALYLSSASVIWYNVSFGQFYTYRPYEGTV
jgi:hypothetical protein